MKKQWVCWVVGFGALFFVLPGIPPVMANSYQLGGDEEFVMRPNLSGIVYDEDENPVTLAPETASFATEDWVGAQEEAPVVAMETPSFATEDWVGTREEAPVVAMETPSFGTEDWVPEIALSEGERPVMEAMETPSFGTEDWVGAQEKAPVVAMETPSFGTEDWVPAIALGENERPVLEAMETPSFGTEDWVVASITSLQAPIDWAAAFNEYHDVVETGALPPAVPREPWTGDNYSE